MTNDLDFLCDIILHVTEVSENLEECTSNLRRRGFAHDRTKFNALEFDAFVSTRDEFKKVNFGTPEYQTCINKTKSAIDHHHGFNRHHIDHWKDGIKDMTLLDILEMLCDWRAASRRSPELTFVDSLNRAVEKYHISPELEKIIRNTLIELRWI